MTTETGTRDVLVVMELLLTAEIFNRNEALDINDLHPRYREFFGAGSGGSTEVKRPLVVSEGAIKKTLGIPDAVCQAVRANPFVGYDEFGQRLSLPSLDAAAGWFLKKSGVSRVGENPALACYFEGKDGITVSYQDVRAKIPRFEDTKEYIEAKVSRIIAGSEEMREARDLLIISAPDEIEFTLDKLVCTPRQEEVIRKIAVALEHREFLKEHGIYEFGRLLFVGPPGTGKTSLALAMSRALHMPVLEVRLAMVTSQYLGETSKNIDRIFDLAKKLSPCILFIDEFDFVAKTRVSDDHGAMKRAVNMLLKNIDLISFVKNGVLLIGATNHPRILDEAAWRRFDEVVEFPLPDQAMRQAIIEKVAATIDCNCDFADLAARTEGFSGSDIRMMMKEAVISALMEDRRRLDPVDIEQGLFRVEERNVIRGTGY
ncbi:MAG TPA: ATP-binding protein [Methanoculleus sp.]|uniref:ATP-binding protein n=1 Tax=Methanoculleus sp. TaxID=90427 RepID=UPI002C9A3C64|nr:ATP-binding protein [Methanoculleus sp.]HNT08027.1 ATP-binding protein [Methanoculleus sp.]HOZ42163.1 ATP-binding protein [Methanoculleus sp.]HPK82234.1 ATP-binding protein [Methanoculleus sp.]HPM54950.1 ATP-binding protein [Methanoculleus sp.]